MRISKILMGAGLIRVVFDKPLPPQPDVETEKELADHDLLFLIRYLSRSRGTTYKLLERPDEQQSELPAPDYLIYESPSGHMIAIEHTLRMKEDQQAAIARLFKAGAEIVMGLPKGIDPVQHGQALEIAVRRKLARGQLQNARADERILLLHNRLMGTHKTYLRAPVHFSHHDKAGVDHAYLIASRRLLGVQGDQVGRKLRANRRRGATSASPWIYALPTKAAGQF